MKKSTHWFMHGVLPPVMLCTFFAMLGLLIAMTAKNSMMVGLFILGVWPFILGLGIFNFIFAMKFLFHAITQRNVLWFFGLVIPCASFVAVEIVAWLVPLVIIVPLVLWLYAETVYCPRRGVKAALREIATWHLPAILLTAYTSMGLFGVLVWGV